MHDLRKVFVSQDATLREIMSRLNNGTGIALVVDDDRRLITTVTDGDWRRALLADHDLDTPVPDWRVYKSPRYREPITSPVGADHWAYLQILMKEHDIHQLPVVDDQGRVIDLILSDFAEVDDLPITAVIMAGGLGTRLRPLTDNTPKPMLPVGNRPILDWIIERLSEARIRKIIVTTHYMGESIKEHLRDGGQFGVDIRYIHEEKLSGTAGALGLIGEWDQYLLVINGDILTRVDFRSMFRYHEEYEADMSVGLREHLFTIPFGVVEMDGEYVTAVHEKPTLSYRVNAGIYVLSRSVQKYITRGELLDMPNLVQRLIDADRQVIGFPIHEYWQDIGHIAQYHQAQEDVRGWNRSENGTSKA